MTEFGHWLGNSNGESMIHAVGNTGATKEQFRAAVTTYCILFDVEVDTKRWDDLMHEMFKYFNCWFNDFDDFDGFMSEDLI